MKIFLLGLFLITNPLFGTEFNGYIVKLKNNYSINKSNLNLKPLNVKIGNFLVFKPTSDKNLDDTLNELRNDPNVEYIEPNWELKNIGITEVAPDFISDEFFHKQWALENTGKNTGGTLFQRPKKGIDIRAKKAWEITKGSEDIIIAMIDSGLMYDHPDLKDNMWKNEVELNGVKGVDDDGNGYIDDIHGFTPPGNKYPNPVDIRGHGTHTAGIIGMSHNGIGGRGIMEKVRIMPIKVKNDKTYKFHIENIVKGIDYAINMGAKLISCSIGGSDYSRAYLDVLKKAEEAGIVFVAAAGNTNKNLDRKKIYPPEYNNLVGNMIVVGNHGPGGIKDYLSNYGKKTVSIFAPGQKIYSTTVTFKREADGLKKPTYKKVGGTSMSSPHVAGAVGLLYSIEPNLNYKEVIDRVIKTAKKEKKLRKYSQSGGRLDIYRLLMDIRD